ncbi:gephyrin-like molybdotransferase Glp [uncultured Hyphomonas sp.]|uniref:molybdopterin molybdotransferase MoeA n=1 Tax=uncultured Hyphomonas sp. TaxID=225298 RepID=UPI002AAC3FEB|nr:gephyrin-like molybdotransferase Glp [uncultured Hyphomonas sp.]
MSGLISVDDALLALAPHALDAGEETVPVGEALGRVLAQDVSARTTTPPADVSAMDGYAVRLADVLEAGNRLQVVGEIPAGTLPGKPVTQGEAMRIFTGAPLPEGADHILIQEEADRTGDTIEVTAPQTEAKHIRKAGRDFSKGDILVTAGTRLAPADLGLAAAGNNGSVTVLRKPKVAILPGGDELLPPGSEMEPGKIIDSNSTALATLVRSWGGDPVTPGIAGDSIEQILALIEAAGDADLILPIGGASVGDYDYMKAAFQEAGAEILFSGIAVRPGKPTWFARRGPQRILGLPGNPASAFVCAHLFLKDLLGKTSGPTARFTAKLETGMAPGGFRETYYRAVSRPGAAGRTVAPLADQDSSLLRPLQMANCLIRRMPNTPAASAGEEVECVSLGD